MVDMCYCVHLCVIRTVVGSFRYVCRGSCTASHYHDSNPINFKLIKYLLLLVCFESNCDLFSIVKQTIFRNVYKNNLFSLFSPQVCHGCSTGQDFIATFLPNYYTKSQRLQLVLTARYSEAKVLIEVCAWFAPHQGCLINNCSFIASCGMPERENRVNIY